jgi:hypothetical protein
MILSSVLALSAFTASAFAQGTSPEPSFDPSAILVAANAPEGQVPAVESAAVKQTEIPQAPAFVLPDNVVLFSEGRTLGALGTKLKIMHQTGDRQSEIVGYLKEAIVDFRRFTAKHLGLRPRMTIQLWDGKEKGMIASATADLVTYAYTVNVRDEQGNLLGYFKEDLLAAITNNHSDIISGDLGKYASFYGLYDSEGKLVARSVKSQDNTGLDFYVERAIYDADGNLTGFDSKKPVAHMAKTPEWKIDTLDASFVVAGQPGKLDPRVLVMIPAYQNFVSKERLREQMQQ